MRGEHCLNCPRAGRLQRLEKIRSFQDIQQDDGGSSEGELWSLPPCQLDIANTARYSNARVATVVVVIKSPLSLSGQWQASGVQGPG